MIEIAILKNYDEESHRAGVQLMGSLTTYLDHIKVARNIKAEDMVTGRHVYVAISDSNPRSAVIIAIFDP